MRDFTDGEVLRILAAMVSATYDDRAEGWAAADEVAHQLGLSPDTPRRPQVTAARLAALERRGLVESKHEGWGKMWRPSTSVREALAR